MHFSKLLYYYYYYYYFCYKSITVKCDKQSRSRVSSNESAHLVVRSLTHACSFISALFDSNRTWTSQQMNVSVFNLNVWPLLKTRLMTWQKKMDLFDCQSWNKQVDIVFCWMVFHVSKLKLRRIMKGQIRSQRHFSSVYYVFQEL